VGGDGKAARGFLTQSYVSGISSPSSKTSNWSTVMAVNDCASMPRSDHLALLVRSSANVSGISPSDSSIPYTVSALMITFSESL
jgi:hypothetical protein